MNAERSIQILDGNLGFMIISSETVLLITILSSILLRTPRIGRIRKNINNRVMKFFLKEWCEYFASYSFVIDNLTFYSFLLSIKDNYEKWIVTMDELPYTNQDGVKYIPAWELGEKLRGV